MLWEEKSLGQTQSTTRGRIRLIAMNPSRPHCSTRLSGGKGRENGVRGVADVEVCEGVGGHNTLW